jgi:glutamate dehydrogenase/leucine dehydrogenase
MATDNKIFGAMLQEFDGAARLLGLDEGIWKMLTSPKRQIIVSCPVLMDTGKIEVFTGYRVQYNITLGPAKGGIRYHPDVTLDEAAGRVDDVEVRRRQHSLRRRQGRRLWTRPRCRAVSSRR